MCFEQVKTDFLKNHKPATRFAIAERDAPKLCKAVIRRQNGLSMLLHALRKSNKESKNYYKPITRIAIVKMTLQSTTSSQQVLRKTKSTLEKTARLLHSLRKFKRTLQGCYTLCGSHNGFFKGPQGVIKTDSPLSN